MFIGKFFILLQMQVVLDFHRFLRGFWLYLHQSGSKSMTRLSCHVITTET